MPNKLVATAALGAGLVIGSIGVATIAPTAIAAAQTTTQSSSAPGGHQHLIQRLRRHEVKVAAGVIGVSPQQLHADLKAGQSVADVANTKGVSVDKVITAIVNDVSSRIDTAVTNHKLSTDRAATLKAKLLDRVTTAVNAHHIATAK
jgi:hypothetical protein